MRSHCDRALAPRDDAGGEIMKPNLRVGLAGLGAIGMAIARRLEAGIPGLALTAAAARDNSAAAARLAANAIAARMVAAAALPEHCDVIVECAPAAAFCSIAARAAAEGSIGSVKLVSRKPPSGLVGAPYLQERGITLAGIAEPVKLFEGSAREGVRG